MAACGSSRNKENLRSDETHHDAEVVAVRELVVLHRLQVNGLQGEVHVHLQQPGQQQGKTDGEKKYVNKQQSTEIPPQYL